MKKFFIIVMLTVVWASKSFALLDTKGTEFWLMFNENLITPLPVAPAVTLYITSEVSTSGTVTPVGLAPIPFTVTANTVTPVSIPVSYRNHVNDVVGDKGIHVAANDEVTVYGLNYLETSTDAFLGLPVDILGNTYMVLSYRNTNVINAVAFGIVATEDNTNIVITPSTNAAGRTAGVPYLITMNRGQTYELRANETAPADLSGTRIRASKPVGVTGSHQCANIPEGFGLCDHICEMLTPTSTWGRHFLTSPLRSRVNGDTWIVMASEDGTEVTINGVTQPILNSGQRQEFLLTAMSEISSNNPVLLAQYSNGSQFAGNPGDPAMIICPPFEQYLGGYTVTTVTGFSNYYINLVAPDLVVGSLTLNGVPVPAVEFSPIGSSGFSGAQLVVAPGSYTLAASRPFGVTQYGFNVNEGYGYPGGFALGQVAEVVEINTEPETSNGNPGSQHCVQTTVTDSGGSPLAGVRVDFEQRGANIGGGYSFTDSSGVAEYCYVGVNTGIDTIIATSGNFIDTVFQIWDDPLPVELSSFTSSVAGRNVTLEWSTSQEINNSKFEIERRSSSENWKRIGEVSGRGNSNSPVSYRFTDRSVTSGAHAYRLKQIDFNGNFEYFNLSNEVVIGVPEKFELSQNYPNPFNPSTKISFAIPVDGKVSLKIFDNSGRLLSEVVNGFRAAGYYTADFNGSNLSSGIYFYRLEHGSGFAATMKMALVK